MGDVSWQGLGDSETSPTEDKARKELKVRLSDLHYELMLAPGGNTTLTPLEIPDYDEISGGQTKNKEQIDFCIRNRKKAADSLTLEIFDDATLIYSEKATSPFLPNGEHQWQWDGYDNNGVLDTKILKSEKLKIILIAKQNETQQKVELNLKNKAKEVEWTDVRIDRNAKAAEVMVRPSFSDGGVEGQGTPTPYSDLEKMAKDGIEHYWKRDGSRGQGIGSAVTTAKGTYKVSVKADVNVEPKAKNFPLIENLDKDLGRSTSFGIFSKIYHNIGAWSFHRYNKSYPDADFKHTAAHEFGHHILNAYGGGVVIPEYSWGHKGTSHPILQTANPNNPIPIVGEVDLMKYQSDEINNYIDYWNRSVAAEQDVKGLIWLTRIKFK